MQPQKFALQCILIASAIGALAQESARTVHYHSQDIVPIRAKVKYTTLIELPATEKIMEAASGDKDFWIVDVVGNFCFVHPAKQGIGSNLNLITDKGNIYFVELRHIYVASWCEVNGSQLVLLPSAQSGKQARHVRYPGDADILGRVTAVTMCIAEMRGNSP